MIGLINQHEAVSMLPEILTVSVEGSVDALVPVTPVTTFKDVSACVRDPGDPLPLILEESPLGARVVAGWERPLELLRLWGNLKDQVFYSASYSLNMKLRQKVSPKSSQEQLRSPSGGGGRDTSESDKIDPWELYELRDELKILQQEEKILDSSFSSMSNSDKMDLMMDLSSDNVDKRTESLSNSDKENEALQLHLFPNESQLLWTSFNSHTKDNNRYKRRRKTYLTEHEQDEHLKNLLEESRTVFRRGTSRTNSFPVTSHVVVDTRRRKVLEPSTATTAGNGQTSPISPILTNSYQPPFSYDDDRRRFVGTNRSFSYKESRSRRNNLKKESERPPLPPTNFGISYDTDVFVTGTKRVAKNPCRSADSHSGVCPPKTQFYSTNQPQPQPRNPNFTAQQARPTNRPQLVILPRNNSGHNKIQSPIPVAKYVTFAPQTQTSPPSCKPNSHNIRQKKPSSSCTTAAGAGATAATAPATQRKLNQLSPQLKRKESSPKQSKKMTKKCANNNGSEQSAIKKLFSKSNNNCNGTTTTKSSKKGAMITPNILPSGTSSSSTTSSSLSTFGTSSGGGPGGGGPLRSSSSYVQKKYDRQQTAESLKRHRSLSETREERNRSSRGVGGIVVAVHHQSRLHTPDSSSDTTDAYPRRGRHTKRVEHEHGHEPRTTQNPGDTGSSGEFRTSRKSRGQQRKIGDHRRSCSDPVYDYYREEKETQSSRRQVGMTPARRRRHSGGGFISNDEVMKDTQQHMQLIPDGGQVTVGELREMATRQQHQIETQQQLLVAREQRLKYLKQQEGRSTHINMESERLRRLKERVEAQEAKLRRLRALRGQVDSSRVNAASLSSDLDAMRHLFSEKEKELVDAVGKVDELTRQLEDIRGGRPVANNGVGPPSGSTNHLQKHHQELDKLRRELLYRNSVNREASTRVVSQKDALANRKEDITRIDTRIAELQQRLHRKRLLNQQLVSQISAATQAKQAQLKAVQQRNLRDGGGKKDNSVDNAVLDEQHRTLEDLAQFDRGKHDPKYQTLPYNTKFSSASKGGGGGGGRGGPYDVVVGGGDSEQQFNLDLATHQHTLHNAGHHSVYPHPPPPAPGASTTSSSVNGPNGGAPPPPPPPLNGGGGSQASVMTRTVHSIPTHPPSKAHASAPVVTSGRLPPPNGSTTRSASVMPPHHPGGSSSSYHPEEFSKSVSQGALPGLSNVSNLDVRPHLPPTSLSISFAQKLNPGAMGPPLANVKLVNKDVENVRALGFPAGSMIAPCLNSGDPQGSSSSSSHHVLQHHHLHSPTNDVAYTDGTSSSSSTDANGVKLKPLLPPKPPVPSKPTPPPRQKGDPMVSSTESINQAGINHKNPPLPPPTQPASIRPQVFRYASQNVILSTYTQQQGGNGQSVKDCVTVNSKLQPTDATASDKHQQPKESVKESDGHVSNHRRIGFTSAELHYSDDPTEDGDAKPLAPAPPPDNEMKLLDIADDTIDRANNNSYRMDILATTCTPTIIGENNNEIDNEQSPVVDVKESTVVVVVGPSSSSSESEKRPTSSSSSSSKKNEANNQSSSSSSSQAVVVRRHKKGNLKLTATNFSARGGPPTRRVSFDPLALLLDASLEGELELVQRTANEVANPSAANDEGITALHNAICAGHLDIVVFLVTFGCDVNAQDSDGWTPLHCAASCNNVAIVRFLVEHGACILASTLSDHDTAAKKCEQEEEGYAGCSQYLYNVQEKLGIMNGGIVYAVYEYTAQNEDELALVTNEPLTVIRRGDEYEREWWWVTANDRSGYVPRNLLGLYPRVKRSSKPTT